MANTLKFGNGEWYGKEGTILAYNSENNNYKPLPFTFDRDSVATRVNKQGLIETVGADQPRVDYLNNTKGHLLLEPSRTNIITNSNSSNLNFTLDGVSMTYNSITSPDGENNGILLKQTGSNSSNSAYNFGLTTADGTYTYSIFIKSNDSEKIRFYSSNGSTLVQDFNPQEMTEGVLSGALNLKFESYGNDWFRVSFTRTLSSASNHRLSIYPDRLNTQKSIYIFGLQIESNASYPTSYIPTQGSAVTRLADSCSQTVPDGVIGQTEGTVYVEINISKLLYQTSRNIIRLGSAVDLVDLSFLATLNNTIRAVIRTSANTRFQAISEIQSVGVYKLAIGYKSNDSVFYVNGVQITNTINTSFTMPSIEDITYNYSSQLNDSVNQTKLYNTRLSNAELAALTQV